MGKMKLILFMLVMVLAVCRGKDYCQQNATENASCTNGGKCATPTCILKPKGSVTAPGTATGTAPGTASGTGNGTAHAPSNSSSTAGSRKRRETASTAKCTPACNGTSICVFTCTSPVSDKSGSMKKVFSPLLLAFGMLTERFLRR